MATRDVSIRLSVKDADIVKRALMQLGKDGQKALKRIERASAPASKGLLAINAAGKEGKAVIQNYAAAAGPIGTVMSSMGMSGLAAAAGVGALTVAFGKAILIAKQGLEDFDKIAKTADKLGIATDSLQALRFAATQTGVSQDVLDVALQRVARRAGDAARGVGEAVGIFKALNVQVKDANGNMRPLDNIIRDVADSIAGMRSDQEKLSATVKLFDTEAAGMVNLLKLGSAGIDMFTQKAKDFGFIVDDHVLRNVEKTNDQLDVLNRIIDVNLKQSFVSLSPILIASAQVMASLAKSVSTVVDSLKEIENRSTQHLIEERKRLQSELDNNNKYMFTYPGRNTRLEDEIKQIDEVLKARENAQKNATNNLINAQIDYNTLANDKIVKSLEDRLRLAQTLNTQGERSVFIAQELAKLNKEATGQQREQASIAAGQLFDLQTAEKKRQLSNSILENNQKYIASLNEQLRVNRILLNEGEAAAEIYKATGRIQIDSTNLQTDVVLDQIEAVKKLVAQYQELQQIQTARALTEKFDPLIKHTKEIKDLNELREKGLISEDVHSKAVLETNKQLRESYKNLMMETRQWRDGTIVALSDIADAHQNEAANAYTFWSNTYERMSASLTEAFNKAKFDISSLKGLFSSIKTDLVGMAVRQQITGPLAASMGMAMGGQPALFNFGGGSSGGLASGVGSFVSNVFGSLFGGFRAEGGDVRPNNWYVVGEKRVPEIFIPKQPGTIVPMSPTRPASSKTQKDAPNPQIDVHVNITSPVTEKVARRSARQVASETYLAVSEAWGRR